MHVWLRMASASASAAIDVRGVTHLVVWSLDAVLMPLTSVEVRATFKNNDA